MSYILDALNKSEAERARKKAPGITVEEDDSGGPGIRPLHLGIGLAVLLLLNSVGLYLFFGDRLPDPGATTVATEPLASAAPQSVVPPDGGLQQASGPVAETATPVATESLYTSRLRPPVPRSALPASIKTRLPEIEITSHIYASDRDLRMARINEEPFGEGDRIAADFWLVEITETGVILAYRDYQFSVDVIEDWQLQP